MFLQETTKLQLARPIGNIFSRRLKEKKFSPLHYRTLKSAFWVFLEGILMPEIQSCKLAVNGMQFWEFNRYPWYKLVLRHSIKRSSGFSLSWDGIFKSFPWY